jgi:hypothetical protein
LPSASTITASRDLPMVTWGMVARVPLFNGLDAAAIAQIMCTE